ncbi:hypothetical protein [Clostridium chromiireducens]|nr:hypothetical protein [Clostridium chromiireducens]
MNIFLIICECVQVCKTNSVIAKGKDVVYIIGEIMEHYINIFHNI